jgi:hypothetical protein
MHLVSQQFGLLHLSSAIGEQKYTHLTYSSQSLLLYDCRHALRVNLQHVSYPASDHGIDLYVPDQYNLPVFRRISLLFPLTNFPPLFINNLDYMDAYNSANLGNPGIFRY